MLRDCTPEPTSLACAVTVTRSVPLVELIDRGENDTDFSTGLDLSTPLTTESWYGRCSCCSSSEL